MAVKLQAGFRVKSWHNGCGRPSQAVSSKGPAKVLCACKRSPVSIYQASRLISSTDFSIILG